MSIPFVIDYQQHRMADALKELLGQNVGKLLDIATAYFAISGYRSVKRRRAHHRTRLQHPCFAG